MLWRCPLLGGPRHKCVGIRIFGNYWGKRMKVSFFCIGIGNGASADAIRETAMNSERLGFSAIWAPEHVVLFDRQPSRYPYDPDGHLPLPKDIDFNDPFIGLA